MNKRTISILAFLPLLAWIIIYELFFNKVEADSGLKLILMASREFGNDPDYSWDSVYCFQRDDIVKREDNNSRIGGIYMPWSDSREKFSVTEIQLKYPLMSFKNDTIFKAKNVGLYYQQIHLLYIPIWNSNRQIVTIWDKNHYLILSEQELNAIKLEYDISNIDIPFWDRIGGKIAWILIILIVIFIAIFDRLKEKNIEKK